MRIGLKIKSEIEICQSLLSNSLYSGMIECLDMIISVGGVGGPIERLCWWKVD